MYDPYFTLKILRSSPRRHRGERTTTIPMKTPPLPVGFAVDGCFILCSFGESVPAVVALQTERKFFANKAQKLKA